MLSRTAEIGRKQAFDKRKSTLTTPKINAHVHYHMRIQMR